MRITLIPCVAILLIACGEAEASCTSLSAALTQPLVDRVVSNGGSLLDQYRDGEPGLSSTLATAVQANTRLTLQPALKLVGRANSRQKVAIGRALGSAMAACRRFEPDTSRLIERALREVTDRDVLSGAYGARTAREFLGSSTSSSATVPIGTLPKPGGGSAGAFNTGLGRPRPAEAEGRAGLGQRDLNWDPFATRSGPLPLSDPLAPLKPVR